MPLPTELLFAPLGGVGEIGMNLALYGLGDGAKRTWMAVDIGVSFAGEELPGVDLIEVMRSRMCDLRLLRLVDGAGHWVQQERPPRSTQPYSSF